MSRSRNRRRNRRESTSTERKKRGRQAIQSRRWSRFAAVRSRERSRASLPPFLSLFQPTPVSGAMFFMRQALFRKGDDRRGLIGVKLAALSRNSTVMQSGEVIGYKD